MTHHDNSGGWDPRDPNHPNNIDPNAPNDEERAREVIAGIGASPSGAAPGQPGGGNIPMDPGSYLDFVNEMGGIGAAAGAQQVQGRRDQEAQSLISQGLDPFSLFPGWKPGPQPAAPNAGGDPSRGLKLLMGMLVNPRNALRDRSAWAASSPQLFQGGWGNGPTLGNQELRDLSPPPMAGLPPTVPPGQLPPPPPPAPPSTPTDPNAPLQFGDPNHSWIYDPYLGVTRRTRNLPPTV
jgi:hypothetical protein